jgi:hypothetical protein
MMNTEPFVIEGDLWLNCQEGGLADDAFVIREREPDGFVEKLASTVTNLHIGTIGLDDAVAEHFGAERIAHYGDRHIGHVRITIERISKDE